MHHASTTGDFADTVPMLSELLLRRHDVPSQAAPSGSGTQMLRRQGFHVGTLHLMVRDEDGSELTELPSVHALPSAPAWFAGMANLHGALVPVLDAAQLLGVQRDTTARRFLFVLGHGEAACGLVIDGVPERLRFDAATRLHEVATPPALEACVRAVYCIDGVDWFDLQPAALFGRLEQSLSA